MKIEYVSNNSGGRWWVDDAGWRALEAAGWRVRWAAEMKAEAEKRQAEGSELESLVLMSIKPDADGTLRYMRALAKEATLECETPGEAMRSFEKATGQRVTDASCNCCGEPHRFSWGGEGTGMEWNCASGEGCLPYLFPDKQIPKDLRAALEGK